MIVPLLARRFPAAQLICAGLVIAAVGFGILTQIDRADPLAVIVTGSVIYSLGISPVVILATDIIVGSAPVERAGAASAISETSSELGGALGIAILGSIGTAVYRSRMAAAMPNGVPAEVDEAARGTLGGATAVAEQLPGQLGAALLGTARDAFTQAFVTTAAVNAVLILLLAIAATLMLRRAQSQARATEGSA
jgi:DHA2 family multidrug resistance protein-like MFS transporter